MGDVKILRPSNILEVCMHASSISKSIQQISHKSCGSLTLYPFILPLFLVFSWLKLFPIFILKQSYATPLKI